MDWWWIESNRESEKTEVSPLSSFCLGMCCDQLTPQTLQMVEHTSKWEPNQSCILQVVTISYFVLAMSKLLKAINNIQPKNIQRNEAKTWFILRILMSVSINHIYWYALGSQISIMGLEHQLYPGFNISICLNWDNIWSLFFQEFSFSKSSSKQQVVSFSQCPEIVLGIEWTLDLRNYLETLLQ